MSINERVKKIRTALSMNQTDFGKKLAVSQNYLSNIESGYRDVTEKILKILCLEFNVNEEWLRTGNGEMFNELDKESQLMSWVGEILGDRKKNFQKAFACTLAKLDDEQWELIAKMAKTLYEEQQREQEEQEEEKE